MSDRYEDRQAVAAKVDWEGGFEAVLDYGLHADDMPEGDVELIEAWTKLDIAWKTFKEAADAVDTLLGAATVAESEGE